MKSSVLKNAGILAISGILAKSFDFAFRSFYSRFLGPEGMGLLALGFGLHGVMLTVSTAGFGVAVSKIVSEYAEQKEYGAIHQSMDLAIGGVSALSLLVIFSTFIGAEWIAVYILGDGRISTSLCALAPSILFMGISYCLKGYFYATRKVWIPALSEFLEQAVKFGTISLLLRYFLSRGIAWSCTAIFLGISIGELSSCVFLALFYLRERTPQGKNIIPRAGLARAILQISLPAMLTSLCGSLFRMQEEVWTVSAFQRFGMDHGQAMGSLGIIHGMVLPMLVFPLTLTGSVTTLLVPEIARVNACRDKRRLRSHVKKIYGVGLGLGLGIMVLFLFLAEPLADLLYHQPTIAVYVRVLAPLCPIMFLDTFSAAVLNGMGKQGSLLCYSLADAGVRLLGILTLVPKLGMPALLGIIGVSNLLTWSLTMGKSIRSVGFGRI